jgi:hypothetical protein
MSSIKQQKGATVRFTVKTVTKDKKGAVISTEYADYTMSEFIALKDKPEPEDVSIQVDGLSEDALNQGTIEIDVPEAFASAYEIRTRVVVPPAGASWSKFVTGRLVKTSKLTPEQSKALCDFFGV